MYLTFGDYINFGDYDIDKDRVNSSNDFETFSRLSRIAEKYIDMYTLSRLKDVPYDEIPQEVKHCMFELIRYISENYADGSVREKKSESNDGYSVSYEGKTAQQVISEIIYTNLFNTDLLYRGTDL